MIRFEKGTRKTAKLRAAMTGVSGSGKTLSALYLAYGITGDWGKIALVDTEHERARFYVDRSDIGTGEFLYAAMYPPYSPARYNDYITSAAQAVGPDGVVIVDSLSHAWNSTGGVLEIKDDIARKGSNNSYTAWNEAGKLQNEMINTILAVPCHTIVTMRSKMAYALELNDRGQQKPVKLGLAPVQREDTEYEFDIVFDIARSHVATVSKDTSILDQFSGVITPEVGSLLKNWLSQGIEPDLCTKCGKAVMPFMNYSAAEVLEKSTAIAGRIMCGECLAGFTKLNKSRKAAFANMGIPDDVLDKAVQKAVSTGAVPNSYFADWDAEIYEGFLNYVKEAYTK